MSRIVETLQLIWLCNFCGQRQQVSLHERVNGSFPEREEYDQHKPFACYSCGHHEHFELKESRNIMRQVPDNR